MGMVRRPKLASQIPHLPNTKVHGSGHPESAWLEACERAVPFHNPDGSTTIKWTDLHKRDCFVLEARQTSED